MKLHSVAAIGLTLISSAVLAQSGSTTPSGTTPATPAVPATPGNLPDPLKSTGPIDIKPNDDGTVGGTATVNPGNGANAGGNATLDPNAQTAAGKGNASLANEQFGKLDANANGFLSKDELKADAKLMTQFNKLDTNHDGKVDQKEYALHIDQKIPPKPVGQTDKRSRSDKAKDTIKNNNQPSDVLPGG